MSSLHTDWKYQGRFLKMGIKQYRLPGQTQIRSYEIVERINKGDHDIRCLDGVNILPILYSPSRKTKEVLLEKIYRPPVNCYCIEFPGGLIDANESKEQAALRELKEETGYTGKLLDSYSAPLLPVCSGTGSESLCLIPVLINLDQEENFPENVKLHLEEDEVIEVFSVPLDRFESTIRDLSTKKYGIELLVYYMALGLALKKRLVL
ncbi:hypothetical protein WA171_006467 [Blastocystis sp. BT1]